MHNTSKIQLICGVQANTTINHSRFRQYYAGIRWFFKSTNAIHKELKQIDFGGLTANLRDLCTEQRNFIPVAPEAFDEVIKQHIS